MTRNPLLRSLFALSVLGLMALVSVMACGGGGAGVGGEAVAGQRALRIELCPVSWTGRRREARSGQGPAGNEFIGGMTDDQLVAFLKEGRRADHPLNEKGVDMPPKGGNPGLSDDDLLSDRRLPAEPELTERPDKYSRLEYRRLIAWPQRLQREAPMLEEILGSGPSRRVLDLGCGTGEHSRFLASQGYEVVGVDASASMIASARQEPVPAGLSLSKETCARSPTSSKVGLAVPSVLAIPCLISSSPPRCGICSRDCDGDCWTGRLC